MELRFLGTGAADWHGKDERGEERAFTSTLFDGKLLIDATETVQSAIPDTVTDVLFTHSHDDHFSREVLEKIAPVTAYIHTSWAYKAQGIKGVTVVPFEFDQPFTAAGYTVTAMPGNHLIDEDWNEKTAHFLLQKEGKTLLYATDGGWFTMQEWDMIRRQPLDAAIFDATIGDEHDGDSRIFGHNSLKMIRYMLLTMHQSNVLPEDAPVYLTHLARTLHPTQKELEERLKGEFIVCYDGMTAAV